MKNTTDLIPNPVKDVRSPNGQTARGRFAQGNLGGPGNPYARRTAALRSALLDAVTEQDIRAVARALLKRAKAGEIPAIRELSTACWARPGTPRPRAREESS